MFFQVGFLGDDLVGNDLEFLDHGGVDPPAQKRYGDEEQNRAHRETPVQADGEGDRRDPGEDVEPHHEFQDP
jgi:hypothetical protein